MITALSASTLVLALRAGEARSSIALAGVIVGAVLVVVVAALALTDDRRTPARRGSRAPC